MIPFVGGFLHSLVLDTSDFVQLWQSHTSRMPSETSDSSGWANVNQQAADVCREPRLPNDSIDHQLLSDNVT